MEVDHIIGVALVSKIEGVVEKGVVMFASACLLQTGYSRSRVLCSHWDGLVALAGLVLVLDDVLLLKLAHSLDFVKVYHETFIVPVQWLNALAAKDVQVVGAVKVLDTLRVRLTKLLRQALLILIFKVETRACQNWVLLDNLVKDVDIEGKSFGTVQLFDKLSANWATHSVLMVQLRDTIRT